MSLGVLLELLPLLLRWHCCLLFVLVLNFSSLPIMFAIDNKQDYCFLFTRSRINVQH